MKKLVLSCLRDNGAFSFVPFVVLIVLFLSAFFFPSDAYCRKYKVGVLCWSMNIPGQVAMRKGLEQEARKINSEALKSGLPQLKLDVKVAGDGESGMKNQIKQMKDMIAAKVDAIIVQPTDNAALVEPLRMANTAGIPVVAYDQYISGGVLSAYRTSDNYQAGFLDGEYLSSLFSPSSEINIVMVEYSHVSSTVERVNGFLDALGRYKIKYRILKSYTAVEPVSGKKAGQQMLKDFPVKGSIDAVFTVNDGGGIAVVAELLKAGRTEIKVATIDGDPSSISNIAAGRLTVVDSAQFCGPLGAESMRATYNILNGVKVPFHALVPVFPVTKKTLKNYPGWMGPVPSGFSKPWRSDFPRWEGNLRVVKP